jgi:hypothetical protein
MPAMRKHNCPQPILRSYNVTTTGTRGVWYDNQFVPAGGVLTCPPIPEPLPWWIVGTVDGHFHKPEPLPTADAAVGGAGFGLGRG